MSDSPSTTDAPTLTSWTSGLTERTVNLVKAKATAFLKHLDDSTRSHQKACEIAELVNRFYFAGDKDRFLLWAASSKEDGGLGIAGSTAYGYVQAGRTMLTFEAELAPYQTREPISIKALAQYDRFTETPELQVKGREAIAREAKAAAEFVAPDGKVGRKAFSDAGVRETVKETPTGDALTAAQITERKVGNIAMKVNADGALKTAFLKATAGRLYSDDDEGKTAREGDRNLFMAGMIQGSEVGAKYGALSPLVLKKLDGEWKVEILAVAIQEANARVEAAKLAADLASITPDAPEEKPDVTITPTPAPAPRKRSTRNPATDARATRKPKATT